MTSIIEVGLISSYFSSDNVETGISGFSCLPIDYETSRLAEEFNIDPMVPALNGGEDYELLFTIPLEMVEKIKMIQSVKVIGHMTSSGSGYYIAGDDGSEVEISAQGWKE